MFSLRSPPALQCSTSRTARYRLRLERNFPYSIFKQPFPSWPGFVPAIHVFLPGCSQDVDARQRRQVHVVCARQTTMAGHDDLKLQLQTRLRILAAGCARGMQEASALKKTRAWGMPGADAPAASCVMKTNTRVSHREVTGNRPAFPHAMVLRLTPRSPRRRVRFCHRRPRIKVWPARLGRLCLRELDTSNGCQNDTASPYAKAPIILHATFRSRGSSRPAIALRA
jgi:hypothetical protein